jgi:hypothetical protein
LGHNVSWAQFAAPRGTLLLANPSHGFPHLDCPD